MTDIKTPFPREELIFCQLDKSKQLSPLKEMQALTRTFEGMRPGAFAYVPTDGGLIKSLTIGSNLLLERATGILDKECESLISSTIDSNKTPALKELLSYIDNFEILASKASYEINKVAGLIRGLTKDYELLLLEGPEEHLSNECQELLKAAVTEAIQVQKKSIIVTSNDIEFWYPKIDKMALRSIDFSFSIETISKDNVIQLTHSKNDREEGQLLELTA